MKIQKTIILFLGVTFLMGLPGCRVTDDKTSKEATIDNNRVNNYYTVSTQLALLSDQAISKLLEKAVSEHEGLGGGAAGTLDLDGTRVFFKKINLTDLERKPENIMSTKNLFDLPLYYQYGLGSAGFGAWRELFCHILSTKWVLTGACQNFPIMYHWRVLPRQVPTLTGEELKHLEEAITYWGALPAIRARLEGIQKASANIVLFLEHIPNTLDKWLEHKFAEGDSAAKKAVEMVEQDLNATISFMQKHDLLHFDAHFRNILTDGHRLYFTDFGLAISSQFELSKAELNFFNVHHDYDRYETAMSLSETIVTSLLGKKSREDVVLHEYAAGKGNSIKVPWAAKTVTRYAPIAVDMLDLWDQLRNNWATPFPASKLENAYKQVKK